MKESNPHSVYCTKIMEVVYAKLGGQYPGIDEGEVFDWIKANESDLYDKYAENMKRFDGQWHTKKDFDAFKQTVLAHGKFILTFYEKYAARPPAKAKPEVPAQERREPGQEGLFEKGGCHGHGIP